MLISRLLPRADADDAHFAKMAMLVGLPRWRCRDGRAFTNDIESARRAGRDSAMPRQAHTRIWSLICAAAIFAAEYGRF